MALSILDGNQSATTLSTILSSGQHITAHTVVSLGTQAITDMRGAVSGSVVSISNLPSTQTIAGTVTANLNANFDVDGNLLVTLQPGSSPVAQLVSGTVTANPTGTQTIAGTVTANLASVVTSDSFWGTEAIKVTGGNGYGIDIAGVDSAGNRAIFDEGGGIPVYPRDNVAGGASFPISGTVTIGSAIPTGTNRIGVVTIGGGTVTLGASTSQIGSVTASISNSLTISSLPAISGTVTANLPIAEAWAGIYDSGNDCIKIELANLNGDALSLSNPLPISGTVTANSSNGSLTTRFGSVTTANTAFATSAVTNTNRKYLLIQNITTASNVITVGIGFTPTTTQGIQLFAGAGLTFEGSYIPTGAVNLLSSVTASCFTILEA